METLDAHIEEPHASTALVKAAEAQVARAEAAPLTITDQRIVAVGTMLKEVYAKASELILTPEEQARLAAEFRDDEIEILPTGELYVPHILIRERLGQVLGAGQWSIVGLEQNIDGKNVNIHFIMTCRKCYVGETWVTKEYISSNPRSSWSDTIEGAEGEAVRRIAAKRLNCGNQVWKPAYGRVWIPKYAVQVWRKQKENSNRANQPQWRRKDCQPFYDETEIVTRTDSPPPSKPVTTVVPARKQPPIPADKGSAPAVHKRKADFLANAEEAGRLDVWAYCVRNGHLGKGDKLESIIESRIPDWQAVADDLAVSGPVEPELEEAYREAHSDGIPGEPEQFAIKPATGESYGKDEWGPLEVRFGKNKGAKFGDLGAKELWWWAMVWSEKPLEPREWQGKVYPPSPEDQKLWNLLNKHKRAMIAHYKFKPATQ